MNSTQNSSETARRTVHAVEPLPMLGRYGHVEGLIQCFGFNLPRQRLTISSLASHWLNGLR